VGSGESGVEVAVKEGVGVRVSVGMGEQVGVDDGDAEGDGVGVRVTDAVGVFPAKGSTGWSVFLLQATQKTGRTARIVRAEKRFFICAMIPPFIGFLYKTGHRYGNNY
jgi:hypothetical protein